ncbi:hypothetical protein A0257_11550 [Hymenobacter psoromatis]|nr:hypothetical protein A0257_11550 [Hymenobacter psoromatis]
MSLELLLNIERQRREAAEAEILRLQAQLTVAMDEPDGPPNAKNASAAPRQPSLVRQVIDNRLVVI